MQSCQLCTRGKNTIGCQRFLKRGMLHRQLSENCDRRASQLRCATPYWCMQTICQLQGELNGETGHLLTQCITTCNSQCLFYFAHGFNGRQQVTRARRVVNHYHNTFYNQTLTIFSSMEMGSWSCAWSTFFTLSALLKVTNPKPLPKKFKFNINVIMYNRGVSLPRFLGNRILHDITLSHFTIMLKYFMEFLYRTK